MDEIREKVRGLVLEIMTMDINEVDNDRKLSTIDQWDSFNNLMLISRIEQEFGITIGVNELASVDCIAAVVTMVKRLRKT